MSEYPETRAKPSVPAESVSDAFDAAIPKAPGYLTGKAKKIFVEMAETLSVAGVLRSADRWVLALCAQAAADVERLTRDVRKEGEVKEGPQKGDVYNMKASVLRDKTRTLMQLCDRLGLSPKARAALQFPEGSAPEVSGDSPASVDQMELFIEESKKLVHAQAWRQADVGGNTAG